MTTNSIETPGEVQARRLETIADQVTALLRRPDVAGRLHAGSEEWSAMQVLGHVIEMIPYWLSHCQTIIAAAKPHHFGRGPDSPERLAGVEQGVTGEPERLLERLQTEVQTAAQAIRAMSPAEWDKTGVNATRGEMSVGAIVEHFIVNHAEGHLAQMQTALYPS
jgi:uncharacterized damage-inducible protein DinB